MRVLDKCFSTFSFTNQMNGIRHHSFPFCLIWNVLGCLLLNLISLAESSPTPRAGLIIFGTTMSPGFIRKEGKLASQCPESHPTAFGNGSFCCESYHRSNQFETNLEWEDPLDLCHNKHFIKCEDFACVTHKNYRATKSCPTTHPIQMNNGCCNHYVNRCNDETIQPTDDPTCCFKDEAFYPESCSKFKLKCRSPNPKSAQTFCPSNPLIERVDGRNYAIVAAPFANVPWKNVGKDQCKEVLGQRLTPNTEIILDTVEVLKRQFQSLPPDQTTVFMVALRKLTPSSTCYTKTSCQGLIIRASDSQPMDLEAELGNVVDEYKVTLTGIGIGLAITLSPLRIELRNIDYAGGSGAYLCLTFC